MYLKHNVVAKKDDYEDEWVFSYVGDKKLDFMNDAYMIRLGGNKNGSGVGGVYLVSIPFFKSTRNMMFNNRDMAFTFIDRFITSNA